MAQAATRVWSGPLEARERNTLHQRSEFHAHANCWHGLTSSCSVHNELRILPQQFAAKQRMQQLCKTLLNRKNGFITLLRPRFALAILGWLPTSPVHNCHEVLAWQPMARSRFDDSCGSAKGCASCCRRWPFAPPADQTNAQCMRTSLRKLCGARNAILRFVLGCNATENRKELSARTALVRTGVLFFASGGSKHASVCASVGATSCA